jgi:hypothetical protein
VQGHAPELWLVDSFLLIEDLFGASLACIRQCAFALCLRIAAYKRAALKICCRGDENRYSIRIGDDDLQALGMHRTTRRKK